MSARSSLAAFIALCVGGGLLIGLSNPPGPWYASLVKPSFNPPNWLFGPVWTTLYAMLAVVGWRTWQRCRGEVGMKLWWSQLALNFAWSPMSIPTCRSSSELERTRPRRRAPRIAQAHGDTSHTPHVVAPARTSRPHPPHAPAPQCSPSAARPSTAPPVSSSARAATRFARSSSRNRAHARPPCTSLPSSAHPPHPHNAASSPYGNGHDTTSANRHRSPPSVHSHPFRLVCAGRSPIVPGARARAAHHASTTSRARNGTIPSAHCATTATGNRANRARAHVAASRQPYPNARASTHRPSTPPRSPSPETAQVYAAAVGPHTGRRVTSPGLMFSNPTATSAPARLDADALPGALARTPRHRPRRSAGRSTASTPRARAAQGRDPRSGRGAGCEGDGGQPSAGA